MIRNQRVLPVVESFSSSVEENLSTIFLDFIYKINPECSITRQFLSGCCEPITNQNYQGVLLNTDTSKILVSKNKYTGDYSEYQVDSLPDNPSAVLGLLSSGPASSGPAITQAEKPARTYKGTNYLEGNTCNPITYYAEEICNLSKQSTLFHLKDILKTINSYFFTSFGDIKNYEDDFTDVDESKILEEATLLGHPFDSSLTNFFLKFNIQIRLQVDANNQEKKSPLLRLQIPREKKQNKIVYDSLDYNKNINNVDQILEFIYQNVVINYDNTENKITFFDKYYEQYQQSLDGVSNTFESSKLNLYQNKRTFTLAALSNLPDGNNFGKTGSTKPLDINYNFVRDAYINYKEIKESEFDITSPFNLPAQLYLVHANKASATREMNDKKETPENYLVNRPIIYWDDIPPFDTDNKDNTHVVILLEDIYLTEYYINNNTPQNLVYWFAWNISKEELAILKKTQENLSKQETFSQLYPYQLLKYTDNSFYIEQELYQRLYLDTGDTLNRFLNLRLRIIPITNNTNEELAKIYRNYQNRQYQDTTLFYEQFFTQINTIQNRLDGDGNDEEEGVSEFMEEKVSIKPKVSTTFSMHPQFKISFSLRIKDYQKILKQAYKYKINWWRTLIKIYDTSKKKLEYGENIMSLYLFVKEYQEDDKKVKYLCLSFRSTRNGIEKEDTFENTSGAVFFKGNDAIKIMNDGLYQFELEQSCNKLIASLNSNIDAGPIKKEYEHAALNQLIHNLSITTTQTKHFYLEDLKIDSYPYEPPVFTSLSPCPTISSNSNAASLCTIEKPAPSPYPCPTVSSSNAPSLCPSEEPAPSPYPCPTISSSGVPSQCPSEESSSPPYPCDILDDKVQPIIKKINDEGKEYEKLGYQSITVPYVIQNLPESANADIYRSFFKKANIKNQDKKLTVFNYGEIVYELEPKKEKLISLPHFMFYQIVLVDCNAIESLTEQLKNIPAASEENLQKPNQENQYLTYLKSPAISKDNFDGTLELSVDGIEVFQVVDGNFTYNIPYQTNNIVLEASSNVSVIIKPNPYLTQKFIWSRFFTVYTAVGGDANKQIEYLTSNKNTGLKLKEKKDLIINLAKAQKFMIQFKAKPTTASNTLSLDLSSVTENYKDYKLIQDNDYCILYYLPTDVINKKNQHTIKFVNIEQFQLYDGSITFLPDTFDYNTYQALQILEIQKFGKRRIKSTVKQHKINCSEDRRQISSHQSLPTISWKWNKELPNKTYSYAIQSYYLRPDNSKKYVYLAWDIPPDKLEHHYQVFSSYRKQKNYDYRNKNIRYSSADHSYKYPSSNLTPTPAPAPAIIEVDINYGKKYVDIDGRECEVKKSGGLLNYDNGTNIEQLSINISIPYVHILKDYELDNTNNTFSYKINNIEQKPIRLEDNIKLFNKLEKFKQVEIPKGNLIELVEPDNIFILKNPTNIYSTYRNYFKNLTLKYDTNVKSHFIFKENNNKFISLEFNKNLDIWQFFHTNNGVKEWLANQSKPGPIFKIETEWIFSPKFHYENHQGKYDYFDFPNQFNPDKKILPNVIDLTRKILLKIDISDTSIIGGEQSNYDIDCTANKSNIRINENYPNQITSSPSQSVCVILNNDSNQFNHRYFNSTLYNIPNISETDAKGNLINLDTNKLDSDTNGNIYYELPIRTEVIVYERIPDSKNEDKAKDMSNLVKTHYLNKPLIETIKKVLTKKIESMVDFNNCPIKAVDYFLREIEDEILTQRGNLDNVLFSEIFEDIVKNEYLNLDKYNSLDEIPNVFRNQKVILDTLEIPDTFHTEFKKYTKNKILHQNYYSYGNLNLKQNETVTLYQIPVDINCLQQNIKNKINLSADNQTKVDYIVQKSIFYSSNKMIQKYIDDSRIYSSIIGENNYVVKDLESCFKFKSPEKETLMYSPEISKKDTGYLTKLKEFKEANDDTIKEKFTEILNLDFTKFNFTSKWDPLSGIDNICYPQFDGYDEDLSSSRPPTASIPGQSPAPAPAPAPGGGQSPAPAPAPEPAPEPGGGQLAAPAPAPEPAPAPGGGQSPAPAPEPSGSEDPNNYHKCDINPDSPENNTNFLIRHRQAVSILYFYNIVKEKYYITEPDNRRTSNQAT
jgi:hypothetical protein